MWSQDRASGSNRLVISLMTASTQLVWPLAHRFDDIGSYCVVRPGSRLDQGTKSGSSAAAGAAPAVRTTTMTARRASAAGRAGDGRGTRVAVPLLALRAVMMRE